ncbi:MAG TPA: hypothetical protein VGF67_14445, partial [Ktedonobacteraceae bacterium]
CPICRAVYIPSWQQEKEKTSLALLESSFLSICHFCFRCQRPACPQCWNPIHCVCTSCSEEAQLPFRSPVPSLEGLIFSCPTEISSTQTSRSFTCLRNGSFHLTAAAPCMEIPQGRQGVFPAPVTPKGLSAQDTESPHRDPPQMQEVTKRGREELADEPVSYAASGQWTQSTVLWPPVQVESQDISSYTGASGPEWMQVSPILPPPHPETVLPCDPPWVQEMLNRGREEQTSRPVSYAASGQWTQSPVLWPPVQAGPQGISPRPGSGRPGWAQMSRILPQQPMFAAHPGAVGGAKSQEEEDEESSLFERIENVLIVVIAAFLLAIVLMLILSLSSAQMNAFFYQLIHIDIRAEILYLLQIR